MDFAQQPRNPTRQMVAIGLVLLLHLGVIYALVTGLARRVIEVIEQPVEVSIVTEIKRAPPKLVLPRPAKVVPPPMVVPVPPSYVPPLAAPVAQPALQTNTIVAVTSVQPAAPVIAVPRRGVRPLDLDACRPQYPRRALREGQTGRGEALLEVASDGRVKSVVITSANPSGVFDKEVIRAMSKSDCRFEASDTPYQVVWPWSFTLNEG
jgi:protein TonB